MYSFEDFFCLISNHRISRLSAVMIQEVFVLNLLIEHVKAEFC